MRYVKSCGFVVYRECGKSISYLLIRSVGGDVGFPKGHTEEGESELQTASRELKEETGIDVYAIPEFRRQIEYVLNGKTDTVKRSVYFLGKFKSGDILCQPQEVEWADFVGYEDALDMLTFAETKSILKAAHEYIATVSRAKT